ncbi:MAG: HIT domain-containing protein [Ruminococcus sp.]|nr:HIT domain-containing protein [Ruminococcus sp.]
MKGKLMNNCIFCKIAEHSIPSMIVYEDDYTVAFMDTAKDVDGHILITPKTHIKNILDCGEEALSQLMNTVKRISCHLVDNCGYE